MRKGSVLVEQVLIDGTIVEQYDTSLTVSELFNVLHNFFPNLKKYEKNTKIYLGEYKENKYAIRCKNVTYLGNPHPFFKKRIQIPDDLMEFYNTAQSLGARPMLLGVYTNEDNTVFVDFKIDTYVENKANNSSAHVYASDLQAATVDGFFQKVDFFGNRVTAFRPDVTGVFLQEFFELDVVTEDSATENVGETCTAIRKPIQLSCDDGLWDAERRALAYLGCFENVILPEFKKFFETLDKVWHGISCYKQMIEFDYKNKYQPEWVGFFLEFCFERYIKENHLENLISYYQDKKDGGVDLDLFFPSIHSFGDLKAHSEDSRGIQGNDWNTIFSILNRNDETSHIYYIVCEHSTEKDSAYDYEVTKFWNTQQKKADIFSYHKRMKNNVVLKKVYILDINYDNREYLTMFKQGINSNGKPRAPKIMIEHDNLKHFVIEEIIL